MGENGPNPPVGRGWYRRVRSPEPETRAEENRMSYLIFDNLLPYLGADAATYWAQLLVVGPL